MHMRELYGLTFSLTALILETPGSLDEVDATHLTARWPFK